MPIRGETIGAAYVRILADGTGFAADAEREVREAEPTFQKAGARHAHAYQEGWDDGRLANPGQEFEEALSRGQGRYNRIGRLLGNGFGQGFEDEIERLFPDIGDRIIRDLRNDLASGSIGEEELINRLHNLRAEANRAYQSIAADNARVFNQMEESVKRYAAGLDNSGRSRRAFLRDIRRMVAALPDVVTGTDSFRASVTNMRRELVSTAPRLKKYREDLEKSGTLLGRMFGKGSRNDFLNFVGGFMQGINTMIRGLASFYKWPGLVAEQIGLLIGKFTALRDEQGTLGAIFSLVKGGAGGVVSILVGVAAAITSISVVLPVFGSLIVGVTGMVLSLAGALGFALVGGAALAAGALVPLGAAIGVVALAIGGLDKKNKDVKRNLKELKDEWKNLQQIAAKGMFGKDGGGLDNLKAVLKAVEPIVKSVSEALGGLLDELGKTAKTKEFKDLMKELGTALGPMVTTLGHIAGNLGLGLIRAFIILEPYINDFLGWMEKVSKAFADAGKDPKGKAKAPLADFFDKAIASAMRVWDLIKAVGTVLGTLFGSGKSTGDNLITSLADQAKELNKWLTSPEGRQALKDLWGFAEDLAKSLGRVVRKAIEFIDALDTPQSRQMLLDILGVIEMIIGWLIVGAGWMNQWIGLTQRAAEFWRGVGSGVLEAAQGIIDGFNTAKDYVVNVLIPDIQDAFAAMTLGDLTVRLLFFFEDLFRGIHMLWDGFWSWWETNVSKLPDPMEIAVRAMLGPWQILYDLLVGHSIIPDLINEIVRLFGTLPGLIFGALGDLVGIFVAWVSPVPGAIAWVVGGIASTFGGLASKIITEAGDIAKGFSDWFSPASGIAGRTATAIAHAFTGLAGRIIREAGSFGSALSGWLAPGPPAADRTSRSIANQFSGMASASIKAAGSLANAVGDWGNAAVREAHSVARGIVNQFSGLANDIEREIGTVHIKVVVDMPNIPRPHVTAIVDMPKSLAVSAPAPAGPQATSTGMGATAMDTTVPVDPAVRAVSGFSGDLRNWASKAKESTGNTENNVAITVITPTEDPRAVASEVFARLTAASYV